MKDQYFGDINDYRKYGLLRAVIGAAGFRVLVAWMLTPDDESTDGKFISYLEHPDRWSRHDPELFRCMKSLLSGGRKRRVARMEGLGLLPDAGYYAARVPETARERDRWFGALMKRARDHDMVFLDPDNGLEVRSKPCGRKGSSKYLYWREVRPLWASGKSLLIFQHFTRETRMQFIPKMRDALRCAAPGSFAVAFSTARVVFLMALQPGHRRKWDAILGRIAESWEGQIRPVD